MLKRQVLAAGLLLLLGAASAHAEGYVMTTCLSSSTVAALTISSTAATNIAPMDAVDGWRKVCVQNLDTTNAVYCRDSVSVSTQETVSPIPSNVGTVIAPSNDTHKPNAPTCFELVLSLPAQRRTGWWCATGNTSGSTNVIVNRCR